MWYLPLPYLTLPVEFLRVQSETIIIAYGGYLFDFPILLVNCMKHNYDWTSLEGGMFNDSMRVLQNSGYKRPGLCKDLNRKRNGHSALEVAYILKAICNKDSEVFNHDGYSFQDILYHLDRKLQLPIYRWCIIWLLVVHRTKS